MIPTPPAIINHDWRQGLYSGITGLINYKCQTCLLRLQVKSHLQLPTSGCTAVKS